MATDCESVFVEGCDCDYCNAAVEDGMVRLLVAKEDIPYVPDTVEEIEDYPPFPFVDLQEFESSEWEDTGESWFVDHSGFGTEGEPALTVSQFKKALKAYCKANLTHGFGITGMGQFQAYVSAFAPR